MHLEPISRATATSTDTNKAMERRANTSRKELFLFFGLTLTIAYTACCAVILGSSRLHLDVDPTLFLFVGAYSPTPVAACLALFGKKGSFRRPLFSVLRWRVRITWWVVSLLSISALIAF